MSAEFFLDTNVFVYSFDQEAEMKRGRSRDLIRRALSGEGAISAQVVQEFCNAALKKFEKPLSPEELRFYQDEVLFPLCLLYPDRELYREALTVHWETRFSWYDSLVLTAALRLGCRVLYSEDMEDGRQFRNVTVRNPFKL